MVDHYGTDGGGGMKFWKKGGYSGGRPASEMSPPVRLPSATIRPHADHRQMWADAEVDREYAVADARHWREGWETVNEQLTLALRREAHLKGIAEDGLRLAALARYHAQGAEISESDREQIRELCDRLQGKPAADACTCAGPFSVHSHGPACLGVNELEVDPWPAPNGGVAVATSPPPTRVSTPWCFCGRRIEDHPPGPPCPPPPPPGVPHG